MSKCTVWVALENGSNPVKVVIDPDDDIDDLCTFLKCKLSIELKDIGVSQLEVNSPDALVAIRRDEKIRNIPANTVLKPLIIGTSPENDATGLGSKILTTPSNQSSASTICNSSFPLLGFGSLPSSFKLDATDGSAVISALCPTDSDIANVSEDMPLVGELIDMIARGESETNGINLIFGSPNSLFCSIANGTTTLNNLGFHIGLATTESYCDHLLKRGESKPYGFIELKGGKFSPLQGNRQSAIYGSHFAMDLLRRGVPQQRAIVPSYTFTGMQIQFGATLVLKPSFPVFWTTSKVLDMADANERRLAVAYIRKAISWVDKLYSTPLDKPISLIGMRFDRSAYHIKTITPSVARRGFQLFSEREEIDISQGVEHWGRVLNLLFADREVRPHVAFPLAIRSPNTAVNEKEHFIIYNDLCKEGYCIGCPDRMKDTELYDVFRKELRRIMVLVHRAGVIHCDLYLSNVMWKKNVKRVDIVIIDWDCAHCLIEGRFYPKVLEALENHKPTRSAPFGTSFDMRYVDVLDREFKESDGVYWTELASGVKENVDNAFYALFSQM
jgi:hypothetical protein